ncbi:ornithine cyclodeaminase family protein [Chloroflexota bacterium]
MLILSNEDIEQVVSMKDCIEALESVHLDLAKGDADHIRRMDIYAPCERDDGYLRWSISEGVTRSLGTVAIRIKSDVLFWPEGKTVEWYSVEPGTYCGLIMLYSTANAEPLALMQDGIISHMRSGGSAGLGAKFMARNDASTVGLLGSGGMARSYLEAFREVRNISRVLVFSPTKEHREEYAEEITRTMNIICEAVDRPELACKGVDILASCTDSMKPTIQASWLEPGVHITDCKPEEIGPDVLDRCDVKVRLGKTDSTPVNPALSAIGQYTQVVIGQPQEIDRIPRVKSRDSRGLPSLVDLLNGKEKGRTSPSQVTYFANDGNQGLQFVAVATRAYERARDKGLGNKIPPEWLLQHIRD